jgi:hypothetical protein
LEPAPVTPKLAAMTSRLAKRTLPLTGSTWKLAKLTREPALQTWPLAGVTLQLATFTLRLGDPTFTLAMHTFRQFTLTPALAHENPAICLFQPRCAATIRTAGAPVRLEEIKRGN